MTTTAKKIGTITASENTTRSGAVDFGSGTYRIKVNATVTPRQSGNLGIFTIFHQVIRLTIKMIKTIYQNINIIILRICVSLLTKKINGIQMVKDIVGTKKHKNGWHILG